MKKFIVSLGIILLAGLVVYIATNQAEESPASCVLGMYQGAKMSKVAKVNMELDLECKDALILTAIEFFMAREIRFFYRRAKKLIQSEIIKEIYEIFTFKTFRRDRKRGNL